ncbi:ATP-binding protein [Bacteroidota bacterium]
MDSTTIVIASTFDELERAIDFIEDFVNTHELNEDLLERMRLVGSEAVTNAIEHGNQLDESKMVTFSIRLVDSYVEMRVSDEGPGFVISEIPDPLASENLLAEGGRGVYFIFEFSDEVVFEQDGAVLLARFRIPDTGSQVPS